MKRILSLVLCMVLMTAPFALAVPLQLEVKGDFIIEREVELENLGVDADISAQRYTVGAEVPVGEWLTLTPRVGLSEVDISINQGVPREIEVDGELGWLVGVDAEIDVPVVDVVDTAIVGGYSFSHTELDSVDLGGIVINNPIEADLYLHEFEVGIKVSKDFSTEERAIPVVPYIKVVYSDMVGDVDVNLSAISLDEDISAKDNLGIRLGIDGEPIDNVKVNLQVSLIDEQSVMGGVSVLF